jgi:hypothetical protein
VKHGLHRRVDISVEISGPHDFAVRFQLARLAHQKRPPHPSPTFVTIAKRPSLIGLGMGGILPVILATDQPRGLRPINATGKSGAPAEIVSSDEQLLQRDQHRCRPCESRDPYAGTSLEAGRRTASGNHNDRWLWVPACAGTTANEAAVTRIALDTPAPRFVNRPSGVLATAGRIAQRESVPFTRERSKVRSLVRPPCFALWASHGAAS